MARRDDREYREFTARRILHFASIKIRSERSRIWTLGAPDRMVSLLTHVAFVNVSHTSASLSSIESTVAARLMSAAGCDGSSQAAEQVDPRCSPASRIRRSRLGCSTRRDKGKLICTQACYSLVAGVSWLSGADVPLLAPAPWPRASSPR